MQNNLNLKKILDTLQFPPASQVNILRDLNEALGYGIYIKFQDKFPNKDKEKLKNLMEQKKAEELILFIIKRTNKKELQKIVQEESEKIIKDFIQKYLSMLNPVQRDETIKRIDRYLPQN